MNTSRTIRYCRQISSNSVGQMNGTTLSGGAQYSNPTQSSAELRLIEGSIPFVYGENSGVRRAITRSPTKESLREGIAQLAGASAIRQGVILLKQRWLGVVGASVGAVFAATQAGFTTPVTQPRSFS
jgi:hypothetical protein